MKKGFFFCVLILSLVAFSLVAIFTGGVSIPAGEVFSVLLTPGGSGVFHTLVWELRFPRILMAVIVGGALAGCGVVFQAILRNPLAEPYTLGVSGGGALGATIAIVAGISGLPMVFMCFAGCCLSVLLVTGMAVRKNFSNTMLILSGVIISFLFSSMVMFIFAVASSREVHSSILWMMGSLSVTGSFKLKVAVFMILPLSLCLIPFARDLNVLTLGDEKTMHLGMDVKKAKIFFLMIASMITAACVAVSGIISFVGLIVPHFVRSILGADHYSVLPASMLSGALLLLFSDTLAQFVVRPLELPVGVITGIAGGVFFLFMLARSRSWEVM